MRYKARRKSRSPDYSMQKFWEVQEPFFKSIPGARALLHVTEKRGDNVLLSWKFIPMDARMIPLLRGDMIRKKSFESSGCVACSSFIPFKSQYFLCRVLDRSQHTPPAKRAPLSRGESPAHPFRITLTVFLLCLRFL